ncbi:MAG: hypothetical protein GY854_32190 [Deltaproteobacteria bacterium]|nr:hypothetical protein [Deltaproteobacteria bacterium]
MQNQTPDNYYEPFGASEQFAAELAQFEEAFAKAEVEDHVFCEFIEALKNSDYDEPQA